MIILPCPASLCFTQNSIIWPPRRDPIQITCPLYLLWAVSNIVLLAPGFPAHLLWGSAQELAGIITEMLTAGYSETFPSDLINAAMWKLDYTKNDPCCYFIIIPQSWMFWVVAHQQYVLKKQSFNMYATINTKSTNRSHVVRIQCKGIGQCSLQLLFL